MKINITMLGGAVSIDMFARLISIPLCAIATSLSATKKPCWSKEPLPWGSDKSQI